MEKKRGRKPAKVTIPELTNPNAVFLSDKEASEVFANLKKYSHEPKVYDEVTVDRMIANNRQAAAEEAIRDFVNDIESANLFVIANIGPIKKRIAVNKNGLHSLIDTLMMRRGYSVKVGTDEKR